MSVSASDPSPTEAEARPIDFAVRRRGFGFADFTPGRTFEHATRRTVQTFDSTLFTTWSLAFLPRYLDRDAALEQGEPDLVVNPMFVFSTVFGLSVEDLSEASTAFLGIDDLRFGVTVHPGDTLKARSVVTRTRRSETRPAGIVTWTTTGLNQRDETVISFVRSNLFKLEPGA